MAWSCGLKAYLDLLSYHNVSYYYYMFYELRVSPLPAHLSLALAPPTPTAILCSRIVTYTLSNARSVKARAVYVTPADRSAAEKVLSLLSATLSSPRRIISVFLTQNTWPLAAAATAAAVAMLVGYGVRRAR